uniref:Uncharacterized protein n=1 Tax=Panagrolaimus superbus TaxID=310955 RepID=A0A914YF84_9BILA
MDPETLVVDEDDNAGIHQNDLQNQIIPTNVHSADSTLQSVNEEHVVDNDPIPENLIEKQSVYYAEDDIFSNINPFSSNEDVDSVAAGQISVNEESVENDYVLRDHNPNEPEPEIELENVEETSHNSNENNRGNDTEEIEATTSRKLIKAPKKEQKYEKKIALSQKKKSKTKSDAARVLSTPRKPRVKRKWRFTPPPGSPPPPPPSPPLPPKRKRIQTIRF